MAETSKDKAVDRTQATWSFSFFLKFILHLPSMGHLIFTLWPLTASPSLDHSTPVHTGLSRDASRRDARPPWSLELQCCHFVPGWPLAIPTAPLCKQLTPRVIVTMRGRGHCRGPFSPPRAHSPTTPLGPVPWQRVAGEGAASDTHARWRGSRAAGSCSVAGGGGRPPVPLRPTSC